MAFPLGWPPPLPSGRRSLRFYVTGTATANYSDNAYLFASQNKGYAVIGGADVNGQVFVHADTAGQTSNLFSIEVRIPTTGHPAALSVAFAPALNTKHIIVSLATLASGAPDAAANTATLVAAAINALAGITSFAGGTGATALYQPEIARFFVGGGTLITPSALLVPGQAIGTPVPTSYGSVLAGGPMGTGLIAYAPADPYGAPIAAVWSNTIWVQNDSASALTVSFDGINTHGSIAAGKEALYRERAEAGIAAAGNGVFRITAW